MTYNVNRLYQGPYHPVNREKYVGNINKIVFRSSLELRFMRWCDLSEKVRRWGSEEIIIPYFSPADNQVHRYFVDFFVEVRLPDGKTKKFLVEVKPDKYTKPPVPKKRKTPRYLSEVVQWGVNNAKWDAARLFAKKMGAEFLLITEKDMN